MKYLIIALLSVVSTSAISKELKLIGTALAEFSIFNIDIYQISYYKSSTGKEELHLDYKMDIEKKYSIMGWEKGLSPLLSKKPSLKPKFKWIISQVVDLKHGDVYIIKKHFDKVSMFKNSILIGEIIDKEIASMVYEPWIGLNPIDNDIKQKLLNLDEKKL
jgi:hypothetical protein